MGLADAWFGNIDNAQSIGELMKHRQFTQTGDQDDSNNKARSMIDAKVAKLQQEQAAAQEAERKRKEAIAAQRGQMIAQQGDASRQSLAGEISGIKKGASSRGLLFSGMAQAGQAGARAGSAQQMADYTARVNQAQDDKLGALQSQQIGNEMKQYGMEASQNVADYSDALQRRRQKQGMISNIAGAAGGALGAALPF